jgi:hypothetical protein
LKNAGAVAGQGVASGKHFTIVAGTDNWLKLRLTGSLDELLRELEAQRVRVAGIEWL